MTVKDATILAGAGTALTLASFALSVAVCSRARRWSWLFGSDSPLGSLRYRQGVSLAGGVAFWISTLSVLGAAALACSVGRPLLPGVILRHVDGLWYRSGELIVILVLSTLVMIAGVTTELFGLGWRARLGSQVLAAAALAGLGIRVTLFWPLNGPIAGGLVTALWVLALVNAFTFLDNMDGLAAGIGVIACLLFSASQVQVGSLFAPAALLVIAGALGGFLVYNRYPARLFLGHGGSWLIGFLLGAMTTAGTYYRYDQGESRNGVLAPLLVMAVPFYESAVVLFLWLGNRGDDFARNPRHYSYRLRGIGLSPAQSVGLLLLVSTGAGLGSLLLRRLDGFGTLVLLGQTACLMAVAGLAEFSAIRRLRSRGPIRRT